MTIMTRRPTFKAALLFLISALFVAGCGDNDQFGIKSSKQTSDKPVTAREVTPPTVDSDLTDKMGADGEALTTVGCVFGTYKEEEPTHVDSVDELKFQAFPPTSGTHFSIWATPGVYETQVPDGFAVHNLEHGEIVIWRGTKLTDDQVKLVTAVPKDGEKWIVTPRPDLEGLFAAAWTKGLSCPPAALAKLTDDQLEQGLHTWYSTVVSTGSEAEKDIPAYAGAMKEPTPSRDISVAAPF